jgi:cellulose synthase/poly-beta-1,6-N-acetylglucosamine synthase-like glycosyltransferase
MLPTLSDILDKQSPRLNPRPVPLISRIIGASAILVFAALLAQAFFRQGLAGWSVGLVYIAYDTALLAFTAWHMRAIMPTSHVENASSAKNIDAARQSLGVIIAAHNEERAIPVTIDALLSQTGLPDLIVIADDGSADGTAALLSDRYGLTAGKLHKQTGRPDMLWLPVEHGGKARALNYAITHVDTDIVLTVDADTLLEEHAIAAIRARFTNEAALVAATGVLTPVCGRGMQGRFFEWFQRYEYIRNFISRFAWMQLNSLLLISGAFAAFRRDAVITVGGFDPECLVEDYELIHRLHRYSHDHNLNWTVRVIGEAQARTDAPETLPAFLRQRRRWFAGFLQTQRWNRDMTGNAKYGALGTAMLPVKALDTLQPLYGISAFIILIGALALGVLTVAVPIIIVMLIKIAIDMIFHLWSLSVYRRWTGGTHSIGWGYAIIAAIIEPVTFQLLRHTGAAWGWWTFLTGRQSWGTQNRGGIMAQAQVVD